MTNEEIQRVMEFIIKRQERFAEGMEQMRESTAQAATGNRRARRMEFEWDKAKAAANFKKHEVTFDEASTVFSDPLARIFDDTEHSAEERREIIVGHSILGRLLLVYFTE